ncbi:MAG: hypothetical protein DMG30_12545, partial [Acidobacteria bacterium]
AALGLVGVVDAALSGLVHASTSQATLSALSGFANGTVWLIFAAYIFSLGYTKTGLGKRIALLLIRAMGRRTLGLGYAIALADLALSPFMPSNTARSGGTLFPILRNIPELYGSLPNDESARNIGAYLMYTALAVTCVTSSMFVTALAPNVLAADLALQDLSSPNPRSARSAPLGRRTTAPDGSGLAQRDNLARSCSFSAVSVDRWRKVH